MNSASLGKSKKRWLIAGLAILTVCIGIGYLQPGKFFEAYVIAYVFWIGISLGSLGFLMIHNLVGGSWGHFIRGSLESGSRTFWAMALLFLPILLGMKQIYVWSNPSHSLQPEKEIYLNVPFFLLRAAFYFAVWIGISRLLTSRLDSRPHQGLNGIGLVLLVLTITFSAFDWVMSIEPHWTSSVFGILFVVEQGLGGLSFAILATLLVRKNEPFTQDQLQDLGSLLFAFVMLWAYIGFSQYLIIWSGNLPEEITWFLNRSKGGWQWIAALIFLFHFLVPFALLLSRNIKRNVKALIGLTSLLVCIRLLHLIWLVAPSFSPERLQIHFLNILIPLGMGAVWTAVFLSNMEAKTPLPVEGRAPR